MHSYRLPLTSNTPLKSPGWRIVFLPVALAIEKQFKTELVIFPPLIRHELSAFGNTRRVIPTTRRRDRLAGG